MRSARLIGGLVCAVAVFAGAQFAHAASVIKLDFGRHDTTNGRATASPDANGNYWNNLSPTGGGVITNGSTFGPFITTANQPTTVGIRTTSGVGTNVGYWESNGRQNGGLLTPDAGLLGDFAVDTATEDYWFLNSPQAGQPSVTLDITGLDPSKSYNFRLFGTRNTDASGARVTRYTLTGSNSGTDTLQTSGPGSASTAAYFGNNDTIVSINGIQPTALGVIQTRLETVSGSFSYLGIMEITETPEPATAAAAVAGAFALVARRRRGA